MISFLIFRLACVLLGTQVSGRTAREPTGALFGGDSSDYVCQAGPPPCRDGTNRNRNRTGW
jgi:hypothetical protein